MTAPARRIGRYVVEQVVGTGAFATVYRAVDERLGATVAVKLLADNHCLDPDIRARFIDEGRALRRIDSPHVVRVYDVGETDQLQPYLVMEHADRGSLAQRVARLRAAGWRPGIEDVRAVAAGLAAAVEAVHGADLVHRDLSPGNILLRSGAVVPGAGSSSALIAPDERLVVADLGLSKDLARNSGLTAAGGTDGFRPPEQRGGPARVDGRADLWALSAVLLWLLTGQAPDADAPGGGHGARQVDRQLADLGLPTALRAPLLTSLDDDPARRHASAAAWLAAVESARPSPTFEESGSGGRHPFPQARRVAAAVALLVAGLAIGAGAMATFGSGGDGDDPPRVTRLDDGRVRAVDTAGAARLTLVGPDEADVGDTVTFEASAEDVAGWVWLMPDGTVYTNEASVQLRTRSAGLAEVTLVGVADSGEHLEVVHELRLVDG